jgi:hypothetical protein
MNGLSVAANSMALVLSLREQRVTEAISVGQTGNGNNKVHTTIRLISDLKA